MDYWDIRLIRQATTPCAAVHALLVVALDRTLAQPYQSHNTKETTR
jgi:hypothetical protein